MFNSSKYIGGFSSLTRGSVHLVNKPGYFVEKPEKKQVHIAKILCQKDKFGYLLAIAAFMQPPT